jgi:hypothetical protein
VGPNKTTTRQGNGYLKRNKVNILKKSVFSSDESALLFQNPLVIPSSQAKESRKFKDYFNRR